MLVRPKQSPRRSLWDTLFFAQYAEFLVDFPPDLCFDRLMGLEQQRRGCVSFSHIETHHGKVTPDEYEFRVGVVIHQRTGSYTSVQFSGAIFRVRDPNKALVRGKFAIGTQNLFAGIVWHLILFFFLLAFPNQAMIAVVIALELFSAWQFYRRYRKLQSLIYKTLQKT